MSRTQNKLRRFRPTIETLEARRLMSVYADFDGDGFDDLAIGVPLEDVGSVVDAGAVHIIYGSASGLSTTGTQLWTQDNKFVVDDSESDDLFGEALAGGDFNNDGHSDLAIGVPGEDIGAISGAGAVQILYGSSSGLTTTGNQIFHQDSPRLREVNEPGDNWGNSLASGDFNGDGFADIAIGAPDESIGSVLFAGSVSILYGGPIGITPVGNQSINLNTGFMQDAPAELDAFGYSLAVGDFNNDGRDDLAVGIPEKDVDDLIGVAQEAGAVSVIYGSSTGLTTSGNQFWHEGISGISSTPFFRDSFGFSLAAGDFDADGRDDLAIGVPFEDVGATVNAGAMHILYGTNGGLSVTYEQFFDQGDADGNPELNDYFSYTLAAADFNGDGRSDLAVGVINERVGVFNESGCVNIMYGSAGGITTSGAFQLVQEDLGTGDESEFNDLFSKYLSAGDFNGNGRADLAISAPRQDVGGLSNAGRVWALYGTTTGFTGGQAWDQNTAGMPDTAEEDDVFGSGLNSSGGKSVPGGGHERHDISHLITADFEAETLLTKSTKRRLRR